MMELANSKDYRILFLSADPSDFGRLRLAQELRDIREKLQLARLRDLFLLESRESARPGDITQAIHDIEPHIVHFAGHGLSTGELCFEDSSGKAQPIPPAALAELFELVKEQVSCVVLNACYSETQAKAIAAHIPFVIGMSKAIGDRAAVAFATGFYKALGAGRSIAAAYKFAHVEIQLMGIPEHLTPVLYQKESKSVSATASLFDSVDHKNLPPQLRSDRNVDYRLLQQLLQAGDWRMADRVTYQTMLQAVGRKEGEHIPPEDLLSFPCSDLHTIDSLWTTYSEGKFGLSVQKNIYTSLGGKVDGDLDRTAWKRFAKQVEWNAGNWKGQHSWEDYETIRFDLSAPAGHLPIACYWYFFMHACHGLGCKFIMRIDFCQRCSFAE